MKVENCKKKNISTICANWHHNGRLPEHLLGVVAHHGQGRSERNGRVCAWYHEPSHFVELARQLRNLGKGNKRMSKCHNMALTSMYNMTRASMIVGTETFAGGPPFPASCTKRFKKKIARELLSPQKIHIRNQVPHQSPEWWVVHFELLSLPRWLARHGKCEVFILLESLYYVMKRSQWIL